MDIIDELVRSPRRKTLAIMITPEGKVVARAPQHMPEKYIREFVEQKKSQILAKKEEQLRQKAQRPPPRQFVENEKFYFKGQPYPLHFIPEETADAPIWFDNAFMISENYKFRVKKLMLGWYFISAETIITERVKLYTDAFNLKYGRIKIADTKSQWGSCSRTGNLSFSWKLVMHPTRIIDYVVAHELAHLKEMNHSKNFWKQVEKMYPEYKESRTWLKSRGQEISRSFN